MHNDSGRWPGPRRRADPVIEAYMKSIDRTLLRQNLRRSPTERVGNLMALQRLAIEARLAGLRHAAAHD